MSKGRGPPSKPIIELLSILCSNGYDIHEKLKQNLYKNLVMIIKNDSSDKRFDAFKKKLNQTDFRESEPLSKLITNRLENLKKISEKKIKSLWNYISDFQNRVAEPFKKCLLDNFDETFLSEDFRKNLNFENFDDATKIEISLCLVEHFFLVGSGTEHTLNEKISNLTSNLKRLLENQPNLNKKEENKHFRQKKSKKTPPLVSEISKKKAAPNRTKKNKNSISEKDTSASSTIEEKKRRIKESENLILYNCVTDEFYPEQPNFNNINRREEASYTEQILFGDPMLLEELFEAENQDTHWQSEQIERDISLADRPQPACQFLDQNAPHHESDQLSSNQESLYSQEFTSTHSSSLDNRGSIPERNNATYLYTFESDSEDVDSCIWTDENELQDFTINK